ncbi:MAG: hypothetical protein C4295_09150 [Candidatus Fervidibacterota bacterium]
MRLALAQRAVNGMANAFCLAFLIVTFLALLCYYGETMMPVIPDESLFLQPAQSLAEGQGMGTPALDDLLPGISQRTYWQPPVYFLALAAWGEAFGFTIASTRWFSRFCAVGVLLLLWAMAKRFGASNGLAFLCVLWTSLDLAFQYNANRGRMDSLNALLILGSWLALEAHRRDGKVWQALLAGFMGSLATLTHFLAIPVTALMAISLFWRKQWLACLAFLLPFGIGWGFWLLYAMQDWHGFVAQLLLQFARKAEETDFAGIAVKMLFLQSLVPLFGVFPVNTPPIWFALIAVSLWAWHRHRLFGGAQVAMWVALYVAAALGGEVWYVGWFIPFGYLLLTVWANFLWAQSPKRQILLAIGILWGGFQSVQVVRVFSAIPSLKAETERFQKEIVKVLPPQAKVILHSVPDPFPTLRRVRPDLQLVQLSPTPMNPDTLQRLQEHYSFFVGIEDWGKSRTRLSLQPQKEWRFQVLDRGWVVKVCEVCGANFGQEGSGEKERDRKRQP